MKSAPNRYTCATASILHRDRESKRGTGGLSLNFTPKKNLVGGMPDFLWRRSLPRLGVASLRERGQAPSLRAKESQVRKILSWLTLRCRVDANSSTSTAERF